MTEREQFEKDEMTAEIIEKRGYICEICGKIADFYGTPMLAHIVPQKKRNMAIYSKKYIHSRYNLKLTCCLKCNKKAELPRHEWEAHMQYVMEKEAAREKTI